MATYRNKFRLSHISLLVKNSIMILMRGDVPTYITNDIMNRLQKGEKEIVLPMCESYNHKSLVDYLNEYHRDKKKVWKLDFLHHAFAFTSERVKQKLGRFKDVEVEILDFSNTDKRVVVYLKTKERRK